MGCCEGKVIEPIDEKGIAIVEKGKKPI